MIILSLALGFILQEDPGWKALGPSTEGSGLCRPEWGDDASAPAVAHDAAGHPIIAWTQGPFGAKRGVRVRRWTGTEWGTLPEAAEGDPVISGPGDAGPPALVAAAGGDVTVIWFEAAGPVTRDRNAPASLKGATWAGGKWTRLAMPESRSWAGVRPSAVLDSRGRILLAWDQDESGNLEGQDGWASPQTWLLRREGFEWNPIDGNQVSRRQNGGARSQVVIGRGDAPWVSFEERTGSGAAPLGTLVIGVRTPGSPWTGVGAGGGLLVDGIVADHDLAIDAEDRPVIAWMSRSLPDRNKGGSRVGVARFEGGEWKALGADLSEGTEVITGPQVGILTALIDHAGGTVAQQSLPLVSFVESAGLGSEARIRIRQFDGRSWTEAGSPSITGPLASHVLRVDGRRVTIAWRDSDRGWAALRLKTWR